MSKIFALCLSSFFFSCGGLSEMRFDLFMTTPICVKSGASGAKTGRGWADAFPDLASAADYLESNKITNAEIWVAGIFPGGAAADFRTSAAVYGGFTGSESRREERDPSKKRTVIAGNPSAGTSKIFIRSGVDLLIDGFVFSGQTAAGSALSADANSWCTLKNCFFESNAVTGDFSAIVLSSGVKAEINSCVFNGNVTGGGTATYGGPVIHAASVSDVVLNISGCVFMKNTMNNAAGLGGAITVFNTVRSGSVSISNSLFENNYASGTGGAVSLSTVAEIIISATEFYNNAASGSGGALYATISDTLHLSDSKFGDAAEGKGNTAGYGGALYLTDITEVNISLSDFHFNRGTGGGGGALYIASGASTFIDKCRFTDNSNSSLGGGAVYTNSDCSITDTVFRNNKDNAPLGTGGGGAVKSLYSNFVISGCEFIDNITSLSLGGALCLGDGTFNVNTSTFAGNKVLTSSYGGGAVYYSGTSSYLMTNSVFSGNSSLGYGGAIGLVTNNVSFSNLSFFSNTAGTFGGAVYNIASTNNIYNSVMYMNAASSGSSVFNNGTGAVHLYNCAYDGSLGYASIPPVVTSAIILSSSPFNSTDSANAEFLRPNYLLVDKGILPPFEIPSADLAGNRRVGNGVIDAGAYEKR